MKKYIFFVLTLFWMGVIFWFSSKNADVSGEQSQSLTEKVLGFFNINLNENSINYLENIIRKLCHFSEYFILAALSLGFFESVFKQDKVLAFTLLLCIIYAITDEIHQYFIPGRACRFSDILIDASGSFAYAIFIKMLRRMLIRKSNKC